MSALHAGHKVVAGARNPETASENHPEVEAAGGRWLRLDVDSTQTTEIVKKAAEDAGGVDVVVNNAGSFSVGTVEDSEYAYRKIMNCRGSIISLHSSSG